MQEVALVVILTDIFSLMDLFNTPYHKLIYKLAQFSKSKDILVLTRTTCMQKLLLDSYLKNCFQKKKY